METVLVNPVQHHSANANGRDFVVGDLHGCVDALRYLLSVIAFDPSRDRLFSVGDLVDRGEHSEQALALLDKPWFFAVLGNHEDTLCGVADGRMRREWWYGIGGTWAMGLSDERLQEYAEPLRTLPLVRVVGSGKERFNILHAEFFGTDAELDAGNFSVETRARLLWGRELALGNGDPARQRGLSLTYCGHTPMRDIKQIGSQVYIDTGAFSPDGKLTIVQPQALLRWSISVEEARAEGAAALALP
ncbi:putative serine/threonine protein phosphatase [Paraburkholderia ribeironis]|uniref:Putative serine/threonine protein phosphatase n=1 Tax=Paraburkholderia ribeironis TaxID=1247936 RepID=A0A1N7RWR8_9BURK|nr:metallophosphoesterase [Paraburkholderia ribeironis]SIT39529.1 putative serine/threonine protein phosphatase [Paraburkholderia ribeironis]